MRIEIVNTLSNRHPPKILPTIYPSADLPSIFIKHFTNKVEKLRANIASEHATSALVTDSLESDHYCTKSYFNISVSKPSTLYRTVRNIANIDRPSFIAELSSVSEFSSVENANQFCDFLRTVL